MNETQIMLRDMQRRFLQDRYGMEARAAIIRSAQGWSELVWREMAELGLLGALLPERHGGLGGTEDLLLLMAEFGRVLLVEPFISTIVIGGWLFAALDRADLLDAIAAGNMRIAFAHQEDMRDGPITATARREGESYLLNAVKPLVADAPVATHLLLSARLSPDSGANQSGTGLFLVPVDSVGLSCDSFPLIDGRRAAAVRCTDVRLPGDALLCAGDRCEALLGRALDEATVAVCAEAIGVMREMLRQTVDYTGQREQFGVKIASFQVLQHRMVNMLVEIEQAESLVLRATRSRDDPAAVSAAKIRVGKALRAVAHGAVQLHGGIGTTDELPLSHYVRRATAIEREYGAGNEHFVRVTAALGDPDSRDSMLIANDADAAFQQEVRDFISQAFTPELRAAADRQAGLFADAGLAAQWHAILYAKGWIAPSWPVEYGGAGWTPRQRLIFERECALANTPLLPAMGLQMCGPVLIGHGTDEQKARFLPPILSGEHLWCQGYSEPGAGSDLASLKCRMERDGDEYVINGTKIWTTNAHIANWMFLLARTDPDAKPQRGISFVLVPMDSPGITVAPILSMSGEHEVNQLFLDNVRVPVDNRIGPENAGWSVAKYLLEFERGGGTATARTLRVVGLIRRWVASQERLDPEFRHRLAMLEIEIAATEWTQQRMLADIEQGGSIGNANASILKLKAAELFQTASMLFHDMLGPWGLVDQHAQKMAGGAPVGPPLAETGAARYFNSRAISIFGGSSEIQRSILARQALGL